MTGSETTTGRAPTVPDGIATLPLRWIDHASHALLCVVAAAAWAGSGGLPPWVLLVAPLVGVGCIVVHEAGHAAAAVLCGFRLRAVSIGAGPSLRLPVGRVVLQAGLAPFAGAVHYDHGFTRRPQQAMVAASGAAANLVAAGLLVVFGPPLEGNPLLATAVVVNGVMAVAALWPAPERDGRLASDGSEILRLLRAAPASPVVVPVWSPPPWNVPGVVRARLAEGRHVEALALLDRLHPGEVSADVVAGLRAAAVAGRASGRAAWRARLSGGVTHPS